MNTKNDTALSTIVVQGHDSPNAAVIWLHGLGANGNDFVPITEQFGLPLNHKVRFIFPSAPTQPITVNKNMVMPAWYDIFSLSLTAKEDHIGIKKSSIALESLINKQINEQIPSERIILAGFSQGGALSLYTGLRSELRLGGIIALSCYQPLANTLVDEKSNINSQLKIFMSHGMFDPVVPFSVGRETYQQLVELGYPVQWKSYSMQHTIASKEISDIGVFIKQILQYS